MSHTFYILLFGLFLYVSRVESQHSHFLSKLNTCNISKAGSRNATSHFDSSKSPIRKLRNAPSQSWKTCLLTTTENMCEQMFAMREHSRNIQVRHRLPGSIKTRFGYSLNGAPPDINLCMDMKCFCSFQKGSFVAPCVRSNGLVIRKVVRKEIRRLTDDERTRYVNAFNAVRTSSYFSLSSIHMNMTLCPGAHSGPSFHPWHREFVKRMEFALRSYDTSVSIPYWDSSLDARLGNPLSSVIFGDDLMGSQDKNGQVTNGIFARWQGRFGSYTNRQLGQRAILTNFAGINRVMSMRRIEDILASTAADESCPTPAPRGAPEYLHGNNHQFVGGDMLVTQKSTNDPIFFMHHAMVDYIWEMWRQRTQTRAQRATQYPTDNIKCSSQAHFRNSVMEPFYPMANIDGLANEYTDNLYEYEPSPTCTKNNPDCDSRFLYCDITRYECVSRIQAGYACVLIKGIDPCYKSRCTGGRCQVINRREQRKHSKIYG